VCFAACLGRFKRWKGRDELAHPRHGSHRCIQAVFDVLSLDADSQTLAALGLEPLLLSTQSFALGLGQHALRFLLRGRADLVRVSARHRHHLVSPRLDSITHGGLVTAFHHTLLEGRQERPAALRASKRVARGQV
jgi:hypothetical protein